MTAQQLKNSILQMAVSGKLVPQDPNDEPASVLLERIKAEKQELIKVGKIKKDKISSEIFRGTSRNIPYTFCEQIGKEIRDISDEIPFDIPESWEWCKVGNLCSNMSGLSYKKDMLNIITDNMIRVMRGGNILDGSYVLKDDDVYISDQFVKQELHLKKNYMITPSVTSMEHIGKIALIDRDYDNVVVGGFVLMLIPHLNNEVLSKYLLYVFSSKYHRGCCRSVTHKSGQAFYNLSREKLMDIYIPIPPLPEQHRIVSKIEEILPYIEKYEQAETQLTELNTNFPELLKKSILQEAVQGKLVPQDPDDEPASLLLERIRAEKQELIKAGKIKKDKHESVVVTRDKIPYEIPGNWTWCLLSSIINLISGQDFEASDFNTDNKGIPYLTGASNIENGKTILNRWTETPRCIAKKRDLLVVCKGAGVGKMCILEEDQVHIARQIMSIQPIIVDVKYIKVFLEHNLLLLRKSMQGVIPGISRDIILSMPIPLPPLTDQHRIVKKFEELVPIINTLSK